MGAAQLRAHQPGATPPADALHGLVQSHRAAAGSRGLARAVPPVRGRPVAARGEEAPLRQPPRLLRARAARRRAARGGRPGRGGESVRRDRGRERDAPRHGGDPGQGVRLRHRGPVAGSGAGTHAPGRPLRDAAAQGEHVPPLPRASRLPGRATHVRLGRHLERQPDRPASRRTTLLQERARRDPHPTRGRRTSGDARRRRGHPGGQRATALRRRPPAPRLRRAEPDPVRRARPQGRGAGLVRARLDHHRLRGPGAWSFTRASSRAARYVWASPCSG